MKNGDYMGKSTLEALPGMEDIPSLPVVISQTVPGIHIIGTKLDLLLLTR